MANLKFVNLWQTKEERCDKYRLAKMMGANRNQATRMKDWRLSKIERLFLSHPSNYRNRNQHDQQLNNLLSMSPAE